VFFCRRFIMPTDIYGSDTFGVFMFLDMRDSYGQRFTVWSFTLEFAAENPKAQSLSFPTRNREVPKGSL